MKYLCILPVLAGIVLGCATSGGGNQLDSAIYDTHARMVRLEKNLGGSVEKLNETSAELSAQVSSNDRDMDQLRSMLEENQLLLEQLERRFAMLQDTLYKEIGLTGPSTSFGSGAPGAVVIEPPAGSFSAGGALETFPVIENNTGVSNSGFDSTLVSPTAIAPAPPAMDNAAAESAYNSAKAAFEASNYAQALDGFNAVLSAYPNSKQTARTLFMKARSQQRLGKDIEAIETYRALRAEHPASSLAPIAILNQGVSHAKLGERDAAESLWANLISQYPATPAAEQAESHLKTLQQY